MDLGRFLVLSSSWPEDRVQEGRGQEMKLELRVNLRPRMSPGRALGLPAPWFYEAIWPRVSEGVCTFLVCWGSGSAPGRLSVELSLGRYRLPWLHKCTACSQEFPNVIKMKLPWKSGLAACLSGTEKAERLPDLAGNLSDIVWNRFRKGCQVDRRFQ